MRHQDNVPDDPDAVESSPLLNGDNGAITDNGTVEAPPVSKHIDEEEAGRSGSEGSGSQSPIPNADGEAREGLPHLLAKMPILMPALGIGIFLCALDQLLAIAIYARIGSELQALNSTSWIATAYFLTLTSFQPLYGKLSDIFGRKECLLFCYVVFGIGSLGCGLAQNMTQMIIARGVAGIGGGGMNSVVSILLTDIVPLRDRGIWQGYLNIIFAAGTSTGAPLGGLLADTVGWRWSFIGQAPLCLAAFIAVYFVLDMPKSDHSHWRKKLFKIDFLGAFVLIAAVFCLLLGLDNGSNWGWRELSTIIPLALSPALSVAFVLVERYVASHPFAPGRIIFNRTMFASYMCNFWSVMGQMPALFFLPLLWQAVVGLSAVKSGLLLIPASVLGVLGSLFGGYVIRRTGRYYWMTVGGSILLLLSCVPLALGAAADDRAHILAATQVGLIVIAAGGGVSITTTLIGLITNAPKEDAAVVIACSYLFRSLGSAIGISIMSAIFQQVLRTQLAERLALSGDDAAEIEERVRESLQYIGHLAPETAATVRKCYQIASVTVFGADGVPLVFAVLASLWIHDKHVK